ncbi:MAG: hypothetical protein EOM87_05300, partial [Clostridia bacterium]|nr:hypothetical protein [Clostridia bacterium]
MKIFGKERLCYLLKVFEKEKYRNEFIEGNLYLNSSGYFNELDNKHRGDKYDGKKIQFNTEISINGSMYNAKSIVSGFIGDDKIPILCATILDELVLEEKYLDCFILKNKIKEELTKFGKYGLLFLYGELHDNLKTLDDFVKFDQGKVNYVEIGNQEYYNLLKEN